MLGPGDPKLDTTHIGLRRSLQRRSPTLGSEKVCVLIYSIICSRKTEHLLYANLNGHAQSANLTGLRVQERRLAAHPLTPTVQGGKAQAQRAIHSSSTRLRVSTAWWVNTEGPQGDGTCSLTAGHGFKSQLCSGLAA